MAAWNSLARKCKFDTITHSMERTNIQVGIEDCRLTIDNHSERQESQIKEIQEKTEKIKSEIIKIQTSAQAAAQPSAASAKA